MHTTMAIRDDGALLVELEGQGIDDRAVLLSPDGTWIVTVGAAMARGYWQQHVSALSEADERRVQEAVSGHGPQPR